MRQNPPTARAGCRTEGKFFFAVRALPALPLRLSRAALGAEKVVELSVAESKVAGERIAVCEQEFPHAAGVAHGLQYEDGRQKSPFQNVRDLVPAHGPR